MLRLLFVGTLLLSTGALGCGDESGAGGAGGTAGTGGIGGDESGAGGAGGTMMIEPGPTCIAFCAKVAGECEIEGFDSATCAQFCEEDLAMQQSRSESCGDAVELALQCATELDCQSLVDQVNGENLDTYPCLAEATAVQLACPEI